MIGDRPLLGMMLMLGFCILAPFGDAIGKYLSDKIPLIELLVVRFAVQAGILLPIVWMSGQRMLVTRRVTVLALIRTLLHIVGIGTMYLALRYLPLADAIAIAFVMPFIMLLLGKTVLGEEVGMHRLAACAVGFIGTLLVIQPNFIAFGLPALLPLLGAVIFAFFMLITRQIAKEIEPVSLQALNGLMASVVLIPLMLLMPENDALKGPVMPSVSEFWLLGLLGVVGTLAHLFMTGSLKYAPSATLAPMQYLEIPFATLIGWLIFKDLPNGLAGIGIMITMSAGLYVIWRERVRALAQRQPLPAPPAAE
ncbi:MAG: DMT family transporter [Paracoccaceae bacterium]